MRSRDDKKIITAAIVILSAFIIIFTASSAFNINISAKSAGSTMFIGDEPWYDETLFKWALILDMHYVPVTVFSKIDGAEIKENSRLKNLMISYGDKYITIDTDTKLFAYLSDTGEVYMRTYMLRQNTLWVPAKVVCDYFGLKFESTSKGDAIRISDGTSSKTLNDLLAVYNPSLLEPETTEPPAVIKPPADVTTEPDIFPEDEFIGDRMIYMTFEDSPNEYTEDILDMLSDYAVKATFFVTGDGIKNYPDIVRRIITDGHTIALHGVESDEKAYERDFDVFVNELDQENKLLYKIIKQKTRIIRAPNGSSSADFRITSERGNILADKGYTVWDWNVNVPDEIYNDPETIFQSAVMGIKKYSIPVLRMHSNSLSSEYLPMLLKFITVNQNFETIAITPASYEINFIGLFS